MPVVEHGETELGPFGTNGAEVGRDAQLRVVPSRSSLLHRFVARFAKLGVRNWLAIGDAVAAFAALGTSSASLWWAVAATLAIVAFNGGLHLYRSRLSLSLLDDLPRLAIGSVLGGAAIAAASTVGDAALGRAWWLHVGLAFMLIVLGRAGAYVAVRSARRRRVVAHRTLIVGTDHVARYLAELMANRPAAGLVPVAFFDPTSRTDRLSGLPVHTDLSLENATYAADANVVVIAFGDEPDYDSVQRVRDASRLHAEIFFVPRFFELQGISSPDMDHLYDIPLFRLRRWSHRTTAWQIKRAFDAVVAAAVLLALSPLMALTALAVRVTMGSPVLFRQQRIGLGNEPFTILKFRSLPHPPEGGDDTWNSQTTREPNAVGRFIRAFSVDELPQLWNVLRGDMSLVGPRPERPGFVADFSAKYPDYRQRHRVPAGITGLAQVEGLRGDTPIADRARFDNLYVENWSLWNDVKILCRTIGSVFRREGS